MHIHYEQHSDGEKPLFSILIPTWNNLSLVKLCVESIRKNSTYNHQIILHINDGSDGTVAWAKQQQLDFTQTAENVGICVACNAAFTLSKADYIVYINDDMYVCPEWDKRLFRAVTDYGSDDFYFSSTMIERVAANSGNVSSPHNYGDSVENFKEEQLLKEWSSLIIPDWQGANYPPSIMHRRMWNLIGGFSVEFSPGMYSDPDICRKLWAVGVRNFRGIGDSLVYHFMSKSVSRIKKNDGSKQFYQKWRISARTFFDYYLQFQRSTQNAYYKGILSEPAESTALRFKRTRDKIKYWF
ncbi:glycosyltransferase involved in cell wall biosynthesis [Runella defluvii]|uniref:Glycosyltransferase involved in cell wall biosynthesis n=1 Tax=Runella defluvii TaxID=370973 RepID=A0A7W5ZIX3_9BACT|nr:glycosyltransferase [Runella defluvii]MBB3836591.1 glycosyltransferase involved in cell wall biosynthesis [Runella defluvii]